MNKARGIAAGLAIVAGTTSFAPGAIAGKKFEVDENTWASIGMGTRLAYRFTDTDHDEWGGSRDFDIESFRLYFNAQANDWLGFTVNTEKDSSNDDWIRLLDAVVRMEFDELFNVWAGRMLPPSDRSNLDGPYYLGTWDFPIGQAYPANWVGRDNGAAIWGQVDGGRFKYQIGAFEGCKDSNPCDNGHDAEDPLFAGRLTYNFWDPEPGYYNSSDYYGEKEILAIGVVAQHQADIAGTEADPDDFNAYSVDALMQKRLANGGVFTVEGAYYDYDKNDNPGNPGLPEGKGALLLTSYLIPAEVGPGKLQPVARYQRTAFGNRRNRSELGVNYIVNGHNLRVSFIGSRDKTKGSEKKEEFVLGVQYQY